MFLVFIAATIALAAPGQASAVLYGATGTGSGTGTLGTIDPTTGVFTPVGPINDATGQNLRVTGLAIDATNGILYGSTSNTSPVAPGSLIIIDTATGAATVVGGYGFSGQTMADITFLPDGTLLGWLEAADDDLFTIDIATGAATKVGESGLGTSGSGLAADATGTVFFAGSSSDGPLRTIDPSTGAPTVVATLSGSPIDGFSNMAALAFDENGTLFGVNLALRGEEAYLVTIDTETGEITSVGLTVDRLDSIVFDTTAAPEPVAEPATLLLLGSGIAGLGAFARRRRRRV
jgi:hypothetical protein